MIRQSIRAAKAIARRLPTGMQRRIRGHLYGLPVGASFSSQISPELFNTATERLKKLCLFDPADYRRLNSDLAGSSEDAYEHAMSHGFFEDRSIFDGQRVAGCLGAVPDPPAPPPPPATVGHCPPVGVYVSSTGNAFMLELASGLVSDLQCIGVDARLLNEEAPQTDRPPISLVVAPHEFFILGKGKEWINDAFLRSAFMYSTEQVQTSWFGKSIPFLLSSPGVIELAYQTNALLAKTGVPVLHLEPGIHPQPLYGEVDLQHPLVKVLPSRAQGAPDVTGPLRDRPLDVMFVGYESPRRDAFLARHASFFADYECFIYYRRLNRGPLVSKPGAANLVRIGNFVAGHAKIVANVHQSEIPYFEWQRIVQQGMKSGAVVISEYCLPHPVLKPNIHYFEESPRHMANLMEWILKTPDGMAAAEQVRANAFAALAEANDPKAVATRLTSFLIEHAPSTGGITR